MKDHEKVLLTVAILFTAAMFVLFGYALHVN